MKTATFNTIIFIGVALGPTSAMAGAVPEIDCLIEPNMVIELSSPVSGVLDTIVVDRSDTVTKGQIIATLQSDVEQVKLKASKETLNLSRVEQKRSVELYRDNAITLSEKEQADHEVALNELDVEHALANLEQRRIRSPIEGVVADRYLMPGEFIEDNPILKIAQLDPLRVEVVAPVTYFGRIKTGMHARIKTEFGAFDDLVAEVVVVDKVIDAASGTFGIRLELANEDNQIPGGIKCSARFFDEHEEAEYAGVDEAGSEAPAGVAELSGQHGSEEQPTAICRRIGPFSKKDTLMAVMEAIENDISSYQVRDETSTRAAYRVTTDAMSSAEAAKKLEADMKQAGVKDIAVMKSSDGFRISLGLFSKKQSADRRQASMKQLGFDSMIVEKQLKKSTYWAEVTVDKTEDELSALVAAAGVDGTDNLLYQSCSTEILASRK